MTQSSTNKPAQDKPKTQSTGDKGKMDATHDKKHSQEQSKDKAAPKTHK